MKTKRIYSANLTAFDLNGNLIESSVILVSNSFKKLVNYFSQDFKGYQIQSIVSKRNLKYARFISNPDMNGVTTFIYISKSISIL